MLWRSSQHAVISYAVDRSGLHSCYHDHIVVPPGKKEILRSTFPFIHYVLRGRPQRSRNISRRLGAWIYNQKLLITFAIDRHNTFRSWPLCVHHVGQEKEAREHQIGEASVLVKPLLFSILVHGPRYSGS